MKIEHVISVLQTILLTFLYSYSLILFKSLIVKTKISIK